MPGADSYSYLFLVECKKYTHAVPIDDIEEFCSKVEQVAGLNVKALFVSSQNFQKAALNYAKNAKVGVVRYFSDTDVKWTLRRQPFSSVEAYSIINNPMSFYLGMIEEEIQSETSNCYCYYMGAATDSINIVFQNFIGSSRSDSQLSQVLYKKTRRKTQPIKYLAASDIEDVCSKLLHDIGYLDGASPLNSICQREQMLKKLVVNSGVIPPMKYLTKGILGTIKFDPAEITLFGPVNDTDGRQRFTLAHELGHYFLEHAKYMIREYCQERDFGLDDISVGASPIQKLEWQANRFASCLLLPRQTFIRDFLMLADELELEDRGFGILCLSRQKSSRMRYYAISNFLERKYIVSKTVVRIRLEQLGLLTDWRNFDKGTNSERYTSGLTKLNRI